MRDDLAPTFALRPGLTMLNAPAYGVPTRAVLEQAARIRLDIEADPGVLDERPVAALRAAGEELARALGFPSTGLTLTANATAGAAALMWSLPLGTGDQVVLLALEYGSVIRGWQVRCVQAGATFTEVVVPLPVPSAQAVLDVLDATVRGSVSVLQISLVTSAGALLLPVAELAGWGHARGATVLVDAAHGPGHVTVDPHMWGADAVFGTVHKWLPTPRSVGFLWLSEPLRPLVRPGEVSLTWDADNLVERFAWPGTYDPAPRLCVPHALREWCRWREEGLLDRAAALADRAGAVLQECGAVPTGGPELLPPRLRAFLLPGADARAVFAGLAAADIRAPVIARPTGAPAVRLATAVFNDEDDVERLTAVVAGHIR